MRRPSVLAAIIVLADAATAGGGHAAPDRRAAPPTPAPLRVCADPNNLPFSNDKGEGLDNAMARLVARALGTTVEYTWLPQRRGFVRNTLGARRCDVMMEAPVGYQRVETTRPYYRASYVFLTRRDRRLHPRSFDDPRLRGLRIGVQLIGDDYANSPPAELLARRGLGANVVGFPVYGDYSAPAPLAPIADAVTAGSIDAAVVWGPLAGWYAKRSNGALAIDGIAPPADTTAAAGALALSFDIAMAVRHGDDELRRRLDGVIASRRSEIAAVLRTFGIPPAQPVRAK